MFGSRVPVEDLERGQELMGVVQAVRPWGCYVDVGADREGLVHVSHVTGRHVESIYDVVQPGQEVRVWVKEVTEAGKLSLSMVKRKAAVNPTRPDVYHFKGVPLDEWLPGVVTRVCRYGAFVEVTAPTSPTPARGLVHLSEFRDGLVTNASEVVHKGQEVQVRVLRVDLFKRRLALSMKDPFLGPPSHAQPQDVTAFNQVPVSKWHTGRVHHTKPFGVLVELEPPGGGKLVQGLVHVTDMKDSPTSLAKGSEVRVRVLRVDPYRQRLVLSMLEK